MQNTPTGCGSRLPTVLRTSKIIQNREVGTNRSNVRICTSAMLNSLRELKFTFVFGPLFGTNTVGTQHVADVGAATFHRPAW